MARVGSFTADARRRADRATVLGLLQAPPSSAWPASPRPEIVAAVVADVPEARGNRLHGLHAAVLVPAQRRHFGTLQRPFRARFGAFPARSGRPARNVLTDAAYRGMFESVNQEQSRRPDGRRFAFLVRGTPGTF